MGLIRFLRDALSERGVASFSRLGCFLLVCAYVYLMVVTRKLPEHSESFAWVLAALYGSNQLKARLEGMKPGAPPSPPIP